MSTTSQHPANNALLVGIAGGSASGKSTFVRILHEQLHQDAPALQVHSISTDYYFRRDFSQIPSYHSHTFGTDLPDFNHPDALDMHQLVLDLEAMRQGPTPPSVILLEGHLLFYFPYLRELLDVRIFIDLDGETRALRRMVRNLAHPGDPIPDHSAQSIANYYLESAQAGFRQFIEPSRQYADLILRGDGDFQRTAAMMSVMVCSMARYTENNHQPN